LLPNSVVGLVAVLTRVWPAVVAVIRFAGKIVVFSYAASAWRLIPLTQGDL
jgi:hypothetical protein